MDLRRQILNLGLEPDRDAEQAERVLLFRLLLASGMELRARMDRLLADSGLTTQQAMVLQVLQGQDEPPTLKQFASSDGGPRALAVSYGAQAILRHVLTQRAARRGAGS